MRPTAKIREASAHPGPASCLLTCFGDLPGALIELPTSRIRKAAAHPGPASCLLSGFWDLPGALTGRQAPRIRKAAAHPGPASCPLLGFGDLPGALTGRQAPKIREGLQHTQGRRAARSRASEIFPGGLTVLPVPRIRNAYSASRAGEPPAPGFRGSAGCSDRAADAEDPEACSASRARELPALGIWGSAWCSVHMADVEDPEGCSASRAGELPAHVLQGSAWCSVHVADVEDPEGCSTPRAGELPAPGAPWDPPGSDRTACSWGSWDPLGALTVRPVPRIRKAAAHPGPACCFPMFLGRFLPI